MAQSLNKTVEFHTTGVSYLGVGGKVGKILVGNAAFEFYADANVEDYIQIPWQEIERIGANVSGRKISRHFEIYTRAFLIVPPCTTILPPRFYLQNRIFSCIIDANG